jgi:Uma2 family endonuclease
MSNQNLKNIIDILIDDLEKEITEKYENGLLLINNLKSKIKENPDFLFVIDEPRYNKLMDTKEKNQTFVVEISNDIDKRIKKLKKIKSDINNYIKMNDELGILINNQRIGSLLHHSVKESEKIIKDNKLKIEKTIIPELLENANITIKNTKRGGTLKRKNTRKHYK